MRKFKLREVILCLAIDAAAIYLCILALHAKPLVIKAVYAFADFLR